MKPTIVIADDHQIFLDGLRALLTPEYEIVGEASDGESLIEVAEEVKPDLIVSDISMAGMSGLTALRLLMEKGATSKVVLVTMHSDAEYAAEAIDAGASGYVLKSSASSELVNALNDVLGGGVYITPHLAREVLAISKNAKNPPKLTERHQEILKLLVEGKLAKEIGEQLGISPRTVEYHKYQLLRKLELGTTAELIHYAIKEGIVKCSDGAG